jgi:putative sigma-54 modulation protein
MEMRIRSQHMKVDSSLREAIALRLRAALSRLLERIRWVDVQLADINGPRGGVDKRCRITLRMEQRGTVVVEAQDEDLHAAVARASERVARAVVRAMERRRERCSRGFTLRSLQRATIEEAGGGVTQSTMAKEISP